MGFSPSRKQTPRTQTEDLFANLLRGNQSFGQLLTGNLPGWQGQFGVPMNQLESSIFGGVGSAAPDILNALKSLGTDQVGTAIPTAALTNLESLSGPAALEDVFKQMRSANEFGLGRDVANIREQFSASGLRDTTDLARAIAARQAESESGLTSQFGQLGLQNLGQRTSAAGTLGQLGIADVGQRVSQQLQALMGFPQVASGLFGVGEAARGIQEAPLLRQIQEFGRTQGAMLPGLLEFIAGAPQIVGPSPFSQLTNAVVGLASAGGPKSLAGKT